jgi:hypothetical protein
MGCCGRRSGFNWLHAPSRRNRDRYRGQRLHVRGVFGVEQADLALFEVISQQVERYSAGNFIAHGVWLGFLGRGNLHT